MSSVEATSSSASSIQKENVDELKFTDDPSIKYHAPSMFVIITESTVIDGSAKVWPMFFVRGVWKSLNILASDAMTNEQLPPHYLSLTDDKYPTVEVLLVPSSEIANGFIQCFYDKWSTFIRQVMIMSTDDANHKLLNKIEQKRILTNEMYTLIRGMNSLSKSDSGIYWDCYHYDELNEVSDLFEVNEDTTDEALDKQIRDRVRSTPVPMIYLSPLTEEVRSQVMLLVNYLWPDKMHPSWNRDKIFMSSPLIQTPIAINTDGLKTLMAAEFRASKNRFPIQDTDPFIHTLDDFKRIGLDNYPINEFFYRFEQFVGPFFLDLDLSQSYITGSSLCACLNEFKYQDRSWIDDVAILYPVVYTKFETEPPRVSPDDMTIVVENKYGGYVQIDEEKYYFTFESGADVDIAIDSNLSDEEYHRVAQNHIEVIQNHCPYVKVSEHVMPRGGINYHLYTDEVEYKTQFREVEIYRTTFSSICAHHVGVVRGAVTSRWSGNPELYLTSSAVYSFVTGRTPNYNYFASRKNTAQSVILKYQLRGCSMDDRVIMDWIEEYKMHKDINVKTNVFYDGRGMKYSILAAGKEWSYVKEKGRFSKKP